MLVWFYSFMIFIFITLCGFRLWCNGVNFPSKLSTWINLQENLLYLFSICNLFRYDLNTYKRNKIKIVLKIHWWLSGVFKTSRKMYNVFWYEKGCIFRKFIQYTTHFKRFPSHKIYGSKKDLLFSFGSSNFSVLLLIRDSYMIRSTRLASLNFPFTFTFCFFKVY